MMSDVCRWALSGPVQIGERPLSGPQAAAPVTFVFDAEQLHECVLPRRSRENRKLQWNHCQPDARSQISRTASRWNVSRRVPHLLFAAMTRLQTGEIHRCADYSSFILRGSTISKPVLSDAEIAYRADDDCLAEAQREPSVHDGRTNPQRR